MTIQIPTGYGIGACFKCNQVTTITPASSNCLLCGKPLTPLQLSNDPVGASVDSPPPTPAPAVGSGDPEELSVQCSECRAHLIIEAVGGQLNVRPALPPIGAPADSPPFTPDSDGSSTPPAAGDDDDVAVGEDPVIIEAVAKELACFGANETSRAVCHSRLVALGLSDAQARETIDTYNGERARSPELSTEEATATAVDTPPGTEVS